MNHIAQIITSVPVDKNYSMDPLTETLLFDGFELKAGMIVLVETAIMKGMPADLDNPELVKRYLNNNRWAQVLEVRCSRGDRTVALTCLYADGTMSKRVLDVNYAWFVKKSSLPGDDDDSE